jgi:drug/metabolite transporter (DMT)-like permease
VCYSITCYIILAGYIGRVNKTMNDRYLRHAAFAALVISCTIWGTSFALGKLALRDLTVSQLVLLRFGLASLALLPAILIKRAWLDWRDLPHFLLTSILAVPITFLLQFTGLSLTSVVRASLIIGSIPPLLALGGALFLGERVGRRGWAVAVASMLGILLITGSPSSGGSFQGDFLVFLSTLASVVWVLLNKRLSEKYSALIATAYILLIGTISLAPVAIIQDGLPQLSLSLATWSSVIILGVFCTALAFVLWNWGLEQVSASKAGIYINLEPLVGALLGVTFWHDILSARLILGGIIVIGAAIVTTKPERLKDSLQVGGTYELSNELKHRRTH